MIHTMLIMSVAETGSMPFLTAQAMFMIESSVKICFKAISLTSAGVSPSLNARLAKSLTCIRACCT